LRVLESRKGRVLEVIEYLYNLRSRGQFLTTAIPSLLEAALEFDKLVRFINSLLHKMVRLSGEWNLTTAELWEVQLMCERLECSLQTYIDREEKNSRKHLSQIQPLQKKLKEVEQRRDPICVGDMPMTEESMATLDKLSLPLDALWKGKEKLTSLGEGSKRPYVCNLDKAACSKPHSDLGTTKDTAALE
jgi:hypothetical protein